MSISVSPFATEEEFAVLERYAPGSAKRLIDTTLERIELTTEIRRENAKTKRHIDTWGQHYAFGSLLAIFGFATWWVILGYPVQAAAVAIAVIVAVVIAFLASSKIEKVAPFLSNGKQPKDRSDDEE